jgi:quercetin dioxygenase-like cupin family protein
MALDDLRLASRLHGSHEGNPMRRILIATAVCAASLLTVHAAETPPAAPLAKIAIVFDQALPNVPGKSMKGVLVEYGPGGSSPAHIHAPSAFIYATVLEGAIRSQVNDGPAKVFRKGENFSERPGDRHAVSANASDSEPAKLLAVFVVDTADKDLTMPMPK